MSYKSPKWNNGSAPPLSAENMQALTDAVQEQGETLETMCNPNMLDNWYFGNPVNQRGQTSYTGAGYGIDRWKTGDGVATTVANGALNISYSTPGWNLVEPLDNMLIPGATYTLSCIYKASVNPIRLVVAWGSSAFFYNEASPISDDWALAQITGTIPANATISFNQVAIQSLGSSAGDFSLKAIKLELGSQQTLAHQENGVWVLNEIPDYGEQLRRCQRYYQVIQQYSAYPAAIDVNGNLLVAIVLPVEMRIRPAFSRANMNSNIIDAYFATGGRTGVATTPAVGGSPGFANLNFQTIAGKTNMGVIARFVDKCFLSADL